jgi:hypothetical protein
METKKLTCCDIMVGDYVYSTFSDKPCKVQEVKLSEHGYGSVRVSGVDGVKDIVSLSPIPLTAEILEQNGLKNYEEYPEYKIKTNEYEIWVIFDEPQNCVHIEKYDKGIPTIYHSKILFVHELQHALRICGVDKEIVP